MRYNNEKQFYGDEEYYLHTFDILMKPFKIQKKSLS